MLKTLEYLILVLFKLIKEIKHRRICKIKMNIVVFYVSVLRLHVCTFVYALLTNNTLKSFRSSDNINIKETVVRRNRSFD